MHQALQQLSGLMSGVIPLPKLNTYQDNQGKRYLVVLPHQQVLHPIQEAF